MKKKKISILADPQIYIDEFTDQLALDSG